MQPKFYVSDCIYIVNAEKGCVECGIVEEIIIRSDEVLYKLSGCKIDEARENECLAYQEEAEKELYMFLLSRLIDRIEGMLSSGNYLYACAREKGVYTDNKVLFGDDEIDRDIRKILTGRLKSYKEEFAKL